MLHHQTCLTMAKRACASRTRGSVLLLLCCAISPLGVASGQTPTRPDCARYSRSSVLSGLSALAGERSATSQYAVILRISLCDARPSDAMADVWRTVDIVPEVEAKALGLSTEHVSEALAIVLVDVAGSRARPELTRFAALAALASHVEPLSRFGTTRLFAETVADSNVIISAASHGPKRTAGDTLSQAAVSHLRSVLTSLASSDPSDRIRQAARYLLRQRRVR